MQLKEVCYETLYLAQRERIVVTGNSVVYMYRPKYIQYDSCNLNVTVLFAHLRLQRRLADR